MFVLQESRTDATGSFVIYTPVDDVSMNLVLSGGNTEHVPLLPSGFAILPDGTTPNGVGSSNVGSGVGSLVTVSFQILVSTNPTEIISMGSIGTIKGLINCTVERIRNAVASNPSE